MTHPGRNDPCPCGSGKKYKKCCLLNVEQHDFEYRRQRQIEAGLVKRLFAFTAEVLRPDAIEHAWYDFNNSDEVELIPPDDPFNQLFMPWFFFNWVFTFGDYINPEFDDRTPAEPEEEPLLTTIAAIFLVTNEEDLTADQQVFLRTSIQTPYTFGEVLEVRPGAGMKLRDLLRERVYEIIEHAASQTLKRGEILYCAPTECQQIVSNLATSPYPLPAISKVDVLNLRNEILEGLGHDTLNDDDLLEFEDDIRTLYLDLFAEQFAPPHLVNTEGDDWLPQTLYFDLDSIDEAFAKLKDLAGDDYQEELLEERKFHDKKMISAEVPWLDDDGRVLLGLLIFENDQLKIEVNSTARAEQIKEIVEDRLGDHVRYKTTLISPIEKTIEELWEKKLNAEGSESGFEGSPGGFDFDPDSPEVQALMRKSADEHWSKWYDIPVPALNDMTPREAATSVEGRDLLESLLLYYESQSERYAGNPLNPDIPAIRRELGLS